MVYESPYAFQMAYFMLFLGISVLFGALGHTIHYQLGIPFFNLILFLMNAFSLVSMYFLFRASYSYLTPHKMVSNWFRKTIFFWILLMLGISWYNNDFTLIKVNAAFVLLYTLYAHYTVNLKEKDKGNEWLIIGVLVSFIPIIIHSMHLSLHKWFNHKDLAHVFMIISLIIIYKGLYQNLLTLKLKSIA